LETLERYLTGDYFRDRKSTEEVEHLLAEVAETIFVCYRGDDAWPYQVRRDSGLDTNPFSVSTTSMILLAVMRLLGKATRVRRAESSVSNYFPLGLSKELTEGLENVATTASNRLTAEVLKGDVVTTESRTYGQNDPFTRAWLVELANCDWPNCSEAQRNWKIIIACITKSAQDLLTKDPVNPAAYFTNLGQQSLSNAFVPLRPVHSLCYGGREGGDLFRLYSYFETTLHDQLSYSSIPDSRFDPAELAFCLEGMLLSQRETVDRSLFQRVVEVLNNAQQENAYWRPVKPLLATPQGYVLFPVSVEVANSLLRSCSLFDREALHEAFGSASVHLFERYLQWLRARTVSFSCAGKQYVGWHSEHVNDRALIHLWETSQVVEFLLAYRTLLHAHIGRTTLVRSRFSLREPKWRNPAKESWRKAIEKYEPVSCLGGQYKIYERIGEAFVENQANRVPQNYSMLLYGPPGTGKTTVAENLADSLGYRLITITVSDFLAGGEAQMEARAKMIFDVVMAQSGCVVLFDEIDSFLLDRDSERYRNQDTVFQFMTPGMLTKLNDLRKKERVLFAIATNYENRIDSAIKRTGRVDETYLVLSPDSHRRRQILGQQIEEAVAFGGHDFGELDAGQWETLTKASLFLGYSDLKATV
jgi:hypothetical protein